MSITPRLAAATFRNARSPAWLQSKIKRERIKMKTFKLWKLVPVGDPRHDGASWYFKFEFRGKSYKRCLDTANADDAQRNARAKFNSIVKAVQLEEYEDLTN